MTTYPLLGRDETMLACARRAHQTYGGAENLLSHESYAYDLGRFLVARIHEQPDTPQRAALLSIVGREARIACYYSIGRDGIVHALGTLIRLAIPYADHADYKPDWAPVPYSAEPPGS